MELQQTLGGRYTLLDELGTGGMAVVWRARDEVLGRAVAVKVLAGRFADDPQSRARIRDEARAAAMLSHPNVAQIYDYGEAGEDGKTLPYVVMELVNGPTLQQRVAGGPLPARTVFRICGEVAAALAAAHADGLVHRDIKMANVMVTGAGAKVVDFGIAAAVGPASPEEMLVGTPAYLAPERLTGGPVEPASDVYALGVLLYRLLAHEAPWTVETTTQMLSAHIYVEPAPLPTLPGVPPTIADLVARCLRKDPAARPTAADVSATLGDAAEAAVAQTDPVRAQPASSARRVPRPAEGEFGELTAVSMERGRRSTADRVEVTPPPAGAAVLAAVTPQATPAPAGGAAEATSEPRAEAPADEATPAPAAGVAEAPADEATPAPAAGAAEAPADEATPARATGGAAEERSGPRAAAPVGTGRSGAVGGEGNPVPEGKRKVVVAGAAVVALVTAGLAVWGLLAGGDDGRVGAAAGPASVGSPSGAGAPGATADASAVSPTASAVGGRPSASGGPAASAGPSVGAPGGPVAGTAGSTGSAAASSSPAPQGTRLTSPGGVVYAQCAQGNATLTGWEPAAGYSVQNVNPGPALTTDIVFRSESARHRMTVTCVAGMPTSVALPL